MTEYTKQEMTTQNTKTCLYFDLPKFDKDHEGVAPYFAKIKAFVKYYDIHDATTLSDWLILSLEDEALRLFLALDQGKGINLEYLENIFLDHFEYRKHEFLEMEELFSMRKERTESISKFRLRIYKKAYRANANDQMKTFAFKKGLPRDYIVHLAKTDNLKQTANFEKTVQECENYEKLQGLTEYLQEQEANRSLEQIESLDSPMANTNKLKCSLPLQNRDKSGVKRKRRRAKTTGVSDRSKREKQTQNISAPDKFEKRDTFRRRGAVTPAFTS